MTVLAHDAVAGCFVSLHAMPARMGDQMNHFIVLASEAQPQRLDFRYVGQQRGWAEYAYQAARHGLMAAHAANTDCVA